MLSLSMSPTVFSLVVLAISTVAFLKRWIRPKPLPGIPHYPVTSVLGDLPAVKQDMQLHGHFFEEQAIGAKAINELGPVFQVGSNPK